jgi:hypothetical protein
LAIFVQPGCGPRPGVLEAATITGGPDEHHDRRSVRTIHCPLEYGGKCLENSRIPKAASDLRVDSCMARDLFEFCLIWTVLLAALLVIVRAIANSS